MLELAIMIEGQNGLTWPRWKRMARAVEDLGFAGLYRSDHYTNSSPPDKDSLELWVSLTWLADNTERIEFGPLVAPFSFRHPTMVARYASAIDDLSGGRLHLGLGAGWQDREHTNFGLDLMDVKGRFQRLEEGLEVVTRLLNSADPVDYTGAIYRLSEAIMLPRPQRPGGPPILIGGNGPKLTLPLVVRYATMWNGVFIPPETFKERNDLLSAMLRTAGRQPGEVQRSLMTNLVYGRDDAEVERKLENHIFDVTRESIQTNGVLIGTGSEVVEQIGAFAEAGVERLMLQWLDLDDLDGLEAFATSVLPQVM